MPHDTRNDYHLMRMMAANQTETSGYNTLHACRCCPGTWCATPCLEFGPSDDDFEEQLDMDHHGG